MILLSFTLLHRCYNDSSLSQTESKSKSKLNAIRIIKKHWHLPSLYEILGIKYSTFNIIIFVLLMLTFFFTLIIMNQFIRIDEKIY